jgi:hypothetical protein
MDLPIPTYLEHLNKGYFIAYCLNGFFGTKKGKEYLNDIIARFLITFSKLEPLRIKEKPIIKDAGHYYAKIYKLKELQGLKSLSNKKLIPTRAEKFDDFVFWAIKLHCESLINTQGMATFEQLFYFALESFESKETSTLRAKCRSIWNWYDERDWTIPKRNKYNTEEELKELLMTRQERARANAVKREKESKAKVINMITGLYADEFKKKSGAWHLRKIAEATKLTPKTVSKHLKNYELSL